MTARNPLVLVIVVALFAVFGVLAQDQPEWVLPDENGDWIFPQIVSSRTLVGPIAVEIDGVGTFFVDVAGIEAIRNDAFQPGRFSVFDLLLRLSHQGAIVLDQHFDETMQTYVIDRLNGRTGWWYETHYSGGRFEGNAVRMDLYPVKDGMRVRLYPGNEAWLQRLEESFRSEIARVEEGEGRVIIPQVIIRGHDWSRRFIDVEVVPHNARPDLFQPDVITCLDVLLSLGAQGRLKQVGFTWYERIGTADPVDTYYVELIAIEEHSSLAYDRCGFVYQLGSPSLHTNLLVHIPSDIHVLVCPEQISWRWICLGSGRSRSP